MFQAKAITVVDKGAKWVLGELKSALTHVPRAAGRQVEADCDGRAHAARSRRAAGAQAGLGSREGVPDQRCS